MVDTCTMFNKLYLRLHDNDSANLKVYMLQLSYTCYNHDKSHEKQEYAELVSKE